MSMLVLPPRQVNRMGPAYFDGDRVVILSATKPTVRPAEVGGGALVAGDIWVETTTAERWRWNGTVFVSATVIPIRMGNYGISATQAMNTNTVTGILTSPSLPSRRSVLVESVVSNCQTASPFVDGSNYWELRFFYNTTLTTFGNTTEILAGTVVTYNSNNGSLGTNRNRYSTNLGVVLDSTIGMELGYSVTKVLSPGNLSTRICFFVREVQ